MYPGLVLQCPAFFCEDPTWTGIFRPVHVWNFPNEINFVPSNSHTVAEGARKPQHRNVHAVELRITDAIK